MFFAENGCGDYYDYRKNKNGNYGEEIYLWEHKTQESTSVSASLLKFIEQYYEGKIWIDSEIIEKSNHEISEMLFNSIVEEGKTKFE